MPCGGSRQKRDSCPRKRRLPWLDLAKTPDLFRAYAACAGTSTGKLGDVVVQRHGVPGDPRMNCKYRCSRHRGLQLQPADRQYRRQFDATHVRRPAISKTSRAAAILDAWINPLTGKTVKPGHYHTHQKVTANTAEGLRSGENGRAHNADCRSHRARRSSAPTPSWITENFSVKVAAAAQRVAAPPPLVATSMATFARADQGCAGQSARLRSRELVVPIVQERIPAGDGSGGQAGPLSV